MPVDTKLPVLELISAEMAAVVAKSAELSPETAAGASLPQQRAAYLKERAFWNFGGPEMANTLGQTVPTRHGEVPVRVYLPKSTGGSACGASPASPAGPAKSDTPATMVYLHGGGFVLGNLDTHDRIMRTLAAESGMAVMGVDYTLSPEAKFPVAIEQVADAVTHLTTTSLDLDLETSRLVLAGDSAGAMLALATALYLRDTGFDSAKLKAILAYYGLFGLRDSASRRLLGGTWDGLGEPDLNYYFEAYLTNPTDQMSPYVNLISADLSYGIPPCYLVAAEFDPLRDDTTALAMVLKTVGVDHQLELFQGVLHGFLHNSRMLGAAVSALEKGAEFARSAACQSINQLT